MKKFSLVILMLVTLILSSCTGKTEVVAIIDKPADSIYADLKLESVKGGKSINASINTSKDYVDIKIAVETNTTLVYDVIDLDDYLDKSFAGVNVNTLVFSSQTTGYIATFVQELNNKEYGLTAENVGLNLEESNGSKSLFKGLAQTTLARLPQEYDVEKDNVLVVIYLPVYCIYNANGQDVVKSFMLVPVYYNYTYETSGNIEDSNITNLTKFNVTLNENGLLPSQSDVNVSE